MSSYILPDDATVDPPGFFGPKLRECLSAANRLERFDIDRGKLSLVVERHPRGNERRQVGVHRAPEHELDRMAV